MQGYRTMIVAALLFVAPILARWGFSINAEVVADALIIIAPAAMAIMRAITRTPIGNKPQPRNST